MQQTSIMTYSTVDTRQRRLHGVHSCVRPKVCESTGWCVCPFHDNEPRPAIYE